jgi:signal recognition particle subunit SRP14
MLVTRGDPVNVQSEDQEGYFADLRHNTPQSILVRATNGASRDQTKNKVKLSTVIEPDQLEKFYVRYGEVCKLGMQGLKKRDRTGRKKATKAKKRKTEQDGDKNT